MRPRRLVPWSLQFTMSKKRWRPHDVTWDGMITAFSASQYITVIIWDDIFIKMYFNGIIIIYIYSHNFPIYGMIYIYMDAWDDYHWEVAAGFRFPMANTMDLCHRMWNRLWPQTKIPGSLDSQGCFTLCLVKMLAMFSACLKFF